MIYVILAIVVAVVSLAFAGALVYRILQNDQGEAEVRRIGDLIREGAVAFLKREYTILAGFVALVSVVILVFVDLNVLNNSTLEGLIQGGRFQTTGPWLTIAYISGAVASGLAGWIGMSIAVRANTRTATAAKGSLNKALRIAFSSGAVMGFAVVGMGLLGVAVLWLIFENPNVIAGFGFGASSIALFARVGGGIYTKAADVGADMVGKVEAGLPEDDPRNPAVIADNVGDNVGDVAGLGADLFESYVGSIIATIALAFAGLSYTISEPLAYLPLVVAGVGLIASILGTLIVRTGSEASMNKLLWSLRYGIFAAAILMIIGSAVFVFLTNDISLYLLWVVIIGIVVGQVIGTSTEFFTSYEYFPVKWIASESRRGHSANIIAGIAVGLLSTAIPALVIFVGMWLSYFFADSAGVNGLYGIGLAAVSMLATLGITLATDAYGPVADNAGGIAEQAGMPPETRERTDALDALGNTTAATGKGFAIGSAVLTSLALLAAYAGVTGILQNVTDRDTGEVFTIGINLLNTDVLIGVLVGATLPFVFSGMTMLAVGRAASAMIEEVRRQFREIPGLREGKEGVKPDAARAVDISTRGSLRAMILPGVTAIVAPIITGVLLGADGLGGMLAGSIGAGFLLAIFMANTGGAWDNAKKYIEKDNFGGKGSDAHAAAVTGDTVGDPFKDTSGPSINILLKLMAVVSLIFGPLFV